MKFTLLLSLLLMISCGKNGKNGSNGTDGTSTFGINGSSTGVDFEDIQPGLACQNGGVSIFTFLDLNSDGVLGDDESVIKVKALCNGVNASITVENFSESQTCLNGGVKISTTGSTGVEVCNGLNGINGTDGVAGILPVKFCPTDTSPFPEYGLMIGEELFAVHWGSTPGSKESQAFLTKLIAGNYKSTGGNNCLFSIK